MNANQISDVAVYFNELYQGLEKQLEQAERVYRQLPTAALEKPSVTQGWNIVQCLDHLNSYYQHYLPRIAPAAENPDQHIGMVKSGWLGKYLCKMIDPDRGPKRYKAMKKHHPARKLDNIEVIEEFIRHSRELKSLLEKLATKNINCIRIQSSIHPWISLRLSDTLSFLVLHNERHIRQGNRNLASN
ncbi:DinB family protein [Pedobacter sp. GR22-6]|uniref:DinB family protein n=1 Tax=Pedobacter sp. GR22-6 TaxID=3127957 RepID=UPI00307D8629